MAATSSRDAVFIARHKKIIGEGSSFLTIQSTLA
jgi:hypothetical protein